RDGADPLRRHRRPRGRGSLLEPGRAVDEAARARLVGRRVADQELALLHVALGRPHRRAAHPQYRRGELGVRRASRQSHRGGRPAAAHGPRVRAHLRSFRGGVRIPQRSSAPEHVPPAGRHGVARGGAVCRHARHVGRPFGHRGSRVVELGPAGAQGQSVRPGARRPGREHSRGPAAQRGPPGCREHAHRNHGPRGRLHRPGSDVGRAVELPTGPGPGRCAVRAHARAACRDARADDLGQPLPDHGRQEYDDGFRGGNFATPHPQFYRRTAIAPEKAPDHAAYDVLADVLPAARRRRMRLYCWFEDVFRQDIPGFDQAAEIDLHGKRIGLACHRNPNTRAFWLGLAEDYLRSYDVDGLMWGSERQGPLDNALAASHGGGGSGIGCFCPHCLDAARKWSIDVDRAREGYLALERWATGLRAGRRPADGAFVTFWRLLVKYPELLAWERLWNEGLNDTYRDLYRLAKSIAPDKGIGWHIWHNNSFSPFYRAEQDYAEFAKYSDFLKVVMYNNCGGPRL